ncbi:MAG: GNAT family N-acetyltransferase [Candidatus Bathyarchaeota archaeon]|nr:GNAT family N-acetyltransferase [Candidatus Bathyarchaeota archaeon]
MTSITCPEDSLLETVSRKARLEEGREAVRNILREIFRSERISTKNLAYLTRIPIPVTAAVRRELEKAGLITSKKGASLTEKGQEYVTKNLGFKHKERLTCRDCQGKNIRIPDQYIPLLGKLKDYMLTRPKPLPWLDQTHGTPETALLRALYMLEKDDVEGRKIIFLGDDDYTSIAVASLRAAREVTVVDVDTRLLAAIQSTSEMEDLKITCVNHDLRKSLPRNLHGKYDVAFTDPPYTVPGLALFTSRAVSALKPRKGAIIYLAYAHQPPEKTLVIDRTLFNMGLAIVEQIPNFNTYEGAEIFANTTFLARVQTTGKTRPLITSTYSEKIYTGEITQTRRKYRCYCGEEIDVGALESFHTIQELKLRGCPKCGKAKGFNLVERQKLKETLAEKLGFRDFKWTDFPTILEFEREIAKISFPESPLVDEGYHKGKLQKAMKQKSNWLKVATLREEIVGWLWLRSEKDRSTGERFGYIKTIFVKLEHRHQGFGRRLMDCADQLLSEEGIRRIDLIVGATNYDATLFFEEVGFERQYSTMRKRNKSGK